MFGFSLAVEIFQGSAQRTWDCVTQFTNLLWYKFNLIRHPIMPRSRRRHHSKSRSRSRSHSHERDREPKRRKIENVDSPAHKRSVSSEPTTSSTPKRDRKQRHQEHDEEINDISMNENNESSEDESGRVVLDKSISNQLEGKLSNDVITPTKAMSPKQVQRRLESEKKKLQRQSERDEREKKKQEEKERSRLEKLKQKQEKDEQKAKEREMKEEQKRKEKEEKEEQKRKEKEEKEEQKRKEKEEKEAKRKEKEEKEEQKRKEREQEKIKKQQELDEKVKEKQKQEEQKQKAAAAFVNFFVPKKPSDQKQDGGSVGGDDAGKSSQFMPFQIKSDMRLPPPRRAVLTNNEQECLSDAVKRSSHGTSYLKELKQGKKVGKCGKTWPYEEEVILVEEDFGESICEDKPKPMRMRSKFLKFHDNRRPAYFGTWRKKSKVINSRKPFGEDKNVFDYEVDSDDDWEEEDQGESLNGSDDEEKENEVDNDDYEVDNEFFVPHGHLSDDEIDEEPTTKLSPESQKQKLKLLKDEFEQDMQMKTNKIKPRSIGCIWYNKDGSNVDEAIDRHLKPFAMITNGRIFISKRSDTLQIFTKQNSFKSKLKDELVSDFLKIIHHNEKKPKAVVKEFLEMMQNNGIDVNVTTRYLGGSLRRYAEWKVCSEEGPLFNKPCWCVKDDFKKKFNIV